MRWTRWSLLAAALALAGCDGGLQSMGRTSSEEICVTGEGSRTAPVRQPTRLQFVHDEPLLPPHHGRDAVATSCTICHSPRYITMQPRLTRAVWQAEVQKMRKTFGAPVADESVDEIVDYLVFLNGTAEGPEGR